MGVHIQMIGTGNAFSKTYFNNNALVYADDYTLLIDCGITAPQALHQLDKSPADLDGILITHQHSDHIGGLEELAFQLYYGYRKKISLFIPESLVSILWEHSLKGGLHNGEEDCDLSTYFNIIPLQEGQPFEISPQLTVETIRTKHIPNKNSYSLYINDYIFYSADMCFDRPLLEHLVKERQCRYILHECQLEGVGTVHTTLAELLTLPDNIQSMIQLMHYEDNMNDYKGKTGRMTFLLQHQRYYYP